MTDGKIPTWFWVVVGLAIIWNLMGIASYLSDVMMSPEALQQLPQEQQDLRAATPAWLTGVYAIAVFSGIAAAILLALKKQAAIPLFAISLVAVVIQMGFVFFVMDAAAVLGEAAMTLPFVVIVLAALQLWFSMHVKGKTWIA